MKRVTWLIMILVAAATLAPATAFAQGPTFNIPPSFSQQVNQQVIYDSTVSPLPANLPSVGPEAYAYTEFGDEINFASGPRTLKTVTVTLSSWACQNGTWHTDDCATTPGATYSVPITFNIYAVGANDTVVALIATKTQSFNVPYRPSKDDVNCTGDSTGKWYDSSTNTCNNGIAANVTFDFSSMGTQLPDSVIYGIQYNSTHYGPNPIGESASCYSTTAGCFYDSLNIALSPTVTVGSKPHPDTVFQNALASEYCDHGDAGSGTFRLDSPSDACWSGYIPAVQFSATEDLWTFLLNWMQAHVPLFHSWNTSP